MLNARFVTLLAAVLLAVSAAAAPCKPCNNGPRRQQDTLSTFKLPTDGGAAAINPVGLLESHLGDLADVAEGKKDPLGTLVDHAKDAGDAFKTGADAALAAVPEGVKDLAEGAIGALENAVSHDAGGHRPELAPLGPGPVVTGGECGPVVDDCSGGVGAGNDAEDATATANIVNCQE